MSVTEIMLIVIAVLLLAIRWELRSIREHTDTSRRIAWTQHFGEAPLR